MEAAGGHQRPSEAIRGHQRRSEAIVPAEAAARRIRPRQASSWHARGPDGLTPRLRNAPPSRAREAALPCAGGEALAGPAEAPARAHIKGGQGRSREVTGGHQRSSEVSKVIRGSSSSTHDGKALTSVKLSLAVTEVINEVIRAISAPARAAYEGGNQRSSEVIRGHQRTCSSSIVARRCRPTRCASAAISATQGFAAAEDPIVSRVRSFSSSASSETVASASRILAQLQWYTTDPCGGNQWHSVGLSSTQQHSAALSSTQRHSEALRSTQWGMRTCIAGSPRNSASRHASKYSWRARSRESIAGAPRLRNGACNEDE